MSAPTGVTATVSQSGGPGSYVITYSWSATGATSFTYSLNSIIWGVTQTVVGPTTTSSAGSGTYTNTVTGASYQLVVSASNANGTSSATSQQVSVYNPYGGPQGVQGYQGVQGDQGATGPTGLQGSRGLQGLMEINNYTVANQITTTAADTAHLNANSGLTWNGATLNIGGNITGVTTINNTAVGGVTLSGNNISTTGTVTCGVITASTTTSTINGLLINGGAISGATTISNTSNTQSSNFTTPSASSNNIGGVVLSNSRVSASSTLAHNLGLVLFTNGAISNIGSTTSGSFSTTGTVTCGAVTCGAISAPTTGNTINSVIINGGAISGATTISNSGSTTSGSFSTAGTVTCGVITASTTTSTINGLLINGGAISGATTISNSGSTTSGSFSTAGAITTGAATSNQIGGVTLSSTAVSGVSSLAMTAALTGATTLNASAGLVMSNGGGAIFRAIPSGGNTARTDINGNFSVYAPSTTAAQMDAGTNRKLFIPAITHEHAWFENGNGRFGIGTSSPAYALDVNGSMRSTSITSTTSPFITSVINGGTATISITSSNTTGSSLSHFVPNGTFACLFSVRSTAGHYSGLAFFNPAGATPSYIQMSIAYAVTFQLTSATGNLLQFGSLSGTTTYNFTHFTTL